MSEIALSLLLSGWVCPQVQADCAEIYLDGEYILTCYGRDAYPPVTLPCDKAVRIDIDSDGSE